MDMNCRHHTSNCKYENEKYFQEAFSPSCPRNFLVLLSAAHEHGLLHCILESWKRLKLMEGGLNNRPTPRKDEVYLEENVTIAECIGWFELALEVIHWTSLWLYLYGYKIISLYLDEGQHGEVACLLMGQAAASGSDSFWAPIELQSRLLAEILSGL